MKTKICIVVNSLMFGGVEKVIEQYYKNFDQSKFEITIVAQDNSTSECIDFFESLSMKVVLVRHKRKNLVKNFVQIKRIFAEEHFDVVHSNMSSTNFYVLKLAKKYKCPVRINHYHNVFHDPFPFSLMRKFMNHLCDKYSTINLFCSKSVAKFFGPKSDSDKNIVLYNAFDFKLFAYSPKDRLSLRKGLGIGEDVLVVGQIGRFTKQKNYFFSLELVKRLASEKLRFVFVGEGPLKQQIQENISTLGMNDWVSFLPTTNDISPLYSAFDVVIMPSLWEGLGIVALESCCAGCLTLVSDKVPEEALFGDRFSRLTLNPDAWAEIILNYKRKREPAYLPEAFCDKYDIEKNRVKFWNLLAEGAVCLCKN